MWRAGWPPLFRRGGSFALPRDWRWVVRRVSVRPTERVFPGDFSRRISMMCLVWAGRLAVTDIRRLLCSLRPKGSRDKGYSSPSGRQGLLRRMRERLEAATPEFAGISMRNNSGRSRRSLKWHRHAGVSFRIFPIWQLRVRSRVFSTLMSCGIILYNIRARCCAFGLIWYGLSAVCRTERRSNADLRTVWEHCRKADRREVLNNGDWKQYKGYAKAGG